MAQETQKITALLAVTTGTSSVFALNNIDRVGLLVEWSTGVGAGEIVLETAATPDYAGTWNETLALSFPASVPAATADSVGIAALYGRVRVRTTVSGGTATAIVTLQRS
jgi:hypothetical protein